MPGLVGATMRRGGFYAALRQGISHLENNVTTVGECGTVRLKLFNLLLAELGPLVLARGLILEPVELADLLKNIPGRLEVATDFTEPVFLTALFSE
jgi:hypothetical protein